MDGRWTPTMNARGARRRRDCSIRFVLLSRDRDRVIQELRIIAAKGRKTANLVLTFNVVAAGEPCT